MSIAHASALMGILKISLIVMTTSSVSAFIPQIARQSTRRLLSSTARNVLSSRLDGLDRPTVWHEFSPLALEHEAVNLGQGFPDWDPPQFCIDSMRKATDPSFGRNANQIICRCPRSQNSVILRTYPTVCINNEPRIFWLSAS